MDETKLNDLVEIFRELAELSGGYEETKIYTNLEVINASPANLPAGYIIIKDSEDYHIPALKVAGLTYANGDLVNVLFIKGTEPIAFQQGSGSSAVGYALSISDEGVDQGNASTLDFVGAGVTAAVAAGIATITVASSGGWPFTNVLTVSSTDPDADYPDIPSAITAAAASGDNIELDPDTYTAPNVAGGITIDESLSIVGKSPQETVITRADNSSVTVTIADTPVTLRNLTLAHTGAGAGTSTPLSNDQASLVLDNCYLLKSGASGNSIGFSQGGGDSLLRNCKISATNGTILNYAVYLHTAASTCVLDGGEVLAGALAAGHASAVIELRGVRLASGVTLDVSGGGTIKGWYIDSVGKAVMLSPNTLPQPLSSNNNVYAVASSDDSDFVSTIATLPGGATLTFGVVTSGAANAIVPSATTQLAKLVLHNTTRGTEALVSNVVTGTSTITLTANVPAGWQVGDTITARSQTNTDNFSGGAYYFDFELVSAIDLNLCKAITLLMIFLDTNGAAAAAFLSVHPYEAGAAAKRTNIVSQTARNISLFHPRLPIISNRFCAGWDASGAGTATATLRLFGQDLGYS